MQGRGIAQCPHGSPIAHRPSSQTNKRLHLYSIEMVVISTWARVQPFTRMQPTAQSLSMCSGSLWNKELSLSHVCVRSLYSPFYATNNV